MNKIISALIVVLALGGCVTSDEPDRALAFVETQTISRSMVDSQPEAPEIILAPEPEPCQPSDVRFGNGSPTMVIPGFHWGQTYRVDVKNISANCSFTAAFLWYVYDGDTLRWSGECCTFDIGPGDIAVDLRIPSFEITPPQADLAVLAIRVISSN
jgi:hypothetical protein